MLATLRPASPFPHFEQPLLSCDASARVRELSSELSVWYHPPVVMSLAKSSIRSVRRSPIPSTTLLIIIGVCVVWCSCKDQKTIWTAEARSPDGYRLATASTIQIGGPGNAGLYTYVNLKRTNDSRSPDEILGFDENNATMAQAATLNLTMTWTTPSHLNVTYNGRVAELYFQVAKIDGVDISVRDVSSPIVNPSQ